MRSVSERIKRSGPMVAMVSGVISAIIRTIIAAAQILALAALLKPFVPVSGHLAGTAGGCAGSLIRDLQLD